MNKKPILFSTPMVQAILESRKTVTRRIIKPQPKEQIMYCYAGCGDGVKVGKWSDKKGENWFTPPCHGDDVLWVRETWARTTEDGYLYKADYSDGEQIFEKWKPSIFMPKEAVRLFLKVKNVRVEKLREISEEDAIAEGIREFGLMASNGTTKLYGLNIGQQEMSYTAKDEFRNLWDSLNAKRGYGWDVNPWVWVIEFERVEIK